MRRVVFAVFGTIAGLVGLLSFKTHSTSVGVVPAAVQPIAPATIAPTEGETTGSPPSAGSTSGGSSSAESSSAAATKTVTGDAIDTRWGPVQVKITVTGGKITSASAVVYPTENPRDQEINADAIPTLQQESLGRSDSTIDMVSGATYTSTGYIDSLQSALDKAGL